MSNFVLRESNVFYCTPIVIDIGANLTDSMYQGVYHGSQKHQPDLDKVLERSWKNNLSKIIITAGNVEESKKALEIARTDGKYILKDVGNCININLSVFKLIYFNCRSLANFNFSLTH